MMVEKTCITEQELLYRLECPFRGNGSSTGQKTPVLACAERVAQWLIAEICAYRQPTANETWNVFCLYWKQTASFQSRDAIPQEGYQRRLRQQIRACGRLRDIIRRCEILQPVLPYALTVDGVTVTGEYAVLRSSRRKKHAIVLYLRDGGVKLRPLVPDIVSFARRAHIASRWSDLAKNTGVNEEHRCQ